jgi:carbamoyltransferase
MSTNIIGISAFFHDSSACVMRDGVLVGAAAEEHFTRIKHDPGLPVNAVAYCLREAGLTIADIDCIAYYEQPEAKANRQRWMLAQRAAERAPVGVPNPDPDRVTRQLRESMQYDGRLESFDHHLSHAASAFFFSGFQEAAVFTVAFSEKRTVET